LRFVSGTHTVHGGSAGGRFIGTGFARLKGGSLDLDGIVPARMFGVNHGSSTLGSAGILAVDGIFEWTAGTLSGTGSLDIANTGSLWIEGPNTKVQQRVINNAGDAFWSESGDISSGANFNNSGDFEVRNDRNFSWGSGATPPTFNNTGRFRKLLGIGTTTMGVVFTNSGTVYLAAGTVDFTRNYAQSAGSTIMNVGKLKTGTATLQGGTFSGKGTIDGNVSNTGGTVGPGNSPGILTITGNYTQAASGKLSIEIGGTTLGSQYDRLVISGSATLDGTLNVSLINGFLPAAADSFRVLTYGSLTGQFATINGLNSGGAPLNAQYNPTNLTLVAQSTGTP
jgi:hypothetical protein